MFILRFCVLDLEVENRLEFAEVHQPDMCIGERLKSMSGSYE